MSREQLANDIWRACDIMRRDNNCGGIMEYVEHLTWVLFLKFLDEQETIFEAEATIAGRTYTRVLSGQYRWSHWVSQALGEKDPSKTFFGQEKKSVPALLGLMNLVLHGVMTPDIRRRNTLEENIRNVSERFDVVLTNPPFGGTENAQIQQNFPVKSNATELLFIEHIMKKLKPRDSARCGMVVPEGTLFRGGAFATIKADLLRDFNLHMVVSLPPGTFAPYSDVKTGLLFFERPGPTKETLYYELPIPEGLKKFSKGSPVADEHFAAVREGWQKWDTYRRGKGPRPEPTANAWIETAETVAARGYDLSAKNPNRPESEKLPHPAELTATLLERNRELHAILENLHAMLSNGNNEASETP